MTHVNFDTERKSFEQVTDIEENVDCCDVFYPCDDTLYSLEQNACSDLEKQFVNVVVQKRTVTVP